MATVRAVYDIPITGVGTSFDVAKGAEVDMGMFPPDQAFMGYVSLIVLQFSSMASTPTTATIRICRDSAGDEMIVTDTTSTIFEGITTSTKGSACFLLNAHVGAANCDQLHVFAKLNNGSATIDFVEITWGR